MEPDKQNCLHCIHYYITWDKNFPNGCRFFNIKTKFRPSVEVLKASNLACQGFKVKAAKG